MFYEDVFRALNKSRVKYLVAGGIGVVLHGFPRFTADLDLIIHLEKNNIDKFFETVAKLGYRPRLPVTKEEFQDQHKRNEWIKTKNMTVFSFFRSREPMKTIDLFVKEPIRFEVMAKDTAKIKVKDIIIPTLSIKHLIQLKAKAGRPEDLVDIANLKVIQRSKR
jgi:hypothetical protein